MAQLYSALDFGSSGWGLESLRGHFLETQLFVIQIVGFFVSPHIPHINEKVIFFTRPIRARMWREKSIITTANSGFAQWLVLFF